ncbi:MFS general substrate transporter [Xylaria telfairii]|nr:MFS general substrate transporter [Xylaria telfairii]
MLETTTMPSSASSIHQAPEGGEPIQEASSKSLGFWLIIASLCIVAFTASLDGSILAIALPQISSSLQIGDKYVEVANCFLFAQTVVQPGIAQLCNIFGRRWPMIITVVIFALGSGIAGGAKNTATIIAGRTVQGLGSGGIMLLVELIVCDLVPLRERGKYLGIVLSTAALGSIVGPVVGGALADVNWRWCFYLNLPICALVIPIQFLFLRIKHHAPQWKDVITRVDWIGNLVFIASISSLLIGLTFGGTVYPWSSWRSIVPIVLGVAGWASFHAYEYYIKDANPCLPPHIFGNRTSNAALYMIFLTSMLLQWVCLFWPVYFLAVRGTGLTQTGVNFLPYMFLLIPGSAIAGLTLSKTGHYRPLHAVGFVLSTLGPGLNTLLGKNTPAGEWAILQIVDALGRAFILPTTLPAVLASLPERDVAAATGVYSFLRSFGYVWGATIPGIIFNNRFNELSYRISDPTVRQTLADGRAYQFTSGAYLKTLEPNIRSEVLDVYLQALKVVWYGALGFGASGLIAVAVEKHVPLRTNLETTYGMEDKKESELEDPAKVEEAKEGS